MDSSTYKPFDDTTMQSSCLQSSAYGTQSSYIGSIQALTAYYDDEEENMHSLIKSSLHSSLQRAPSSPLPFAVDEDNLSLSNNNLHNQNLQADENKSSSCMNEQSPGSDEGGIVILNPDREHEEEISDSSLHLEQHLDMGLEEPVDSIIMAAAAKFDTRRGGESFEKLLRQAESGHESYLEVVDDDEQSQKSFWDRLRGNTPTRSITMQSASPTSTQQQHPPIRSTQLAQDKFHTEVVILPNNNRTNPRDAMDILANIDLLHLWFDPIPAVFDSTIKDGSGTYSPTHSNEGRHNRDGEWIEISTPPLVLPRDSRISSCIRFFRVKVRSAVGFPARIRSTILIERSAGKMGMTIGPYPDGMTAYHDFHVRMDDDRIVISNEVRLLRTEAEQSSFYFCCICGVLRWFVRVFQWIFLRWYQPDLASYMSQTTASMEKLRVLIERGEGAAYASEELVMEGGDFEGGDNATFISAPLLG